MKNNTLDDRARDVLAVIGEGRVTAEAIGSRLESPSEDLGDTLEQLRENALVRRAGTDRYELTENGVRVLNATGTRSGDESIDTPAEVEDAIASLALPPAEAAAVRGAFSFLRYWGEATAAETMEAIHEEAPAGYDDPDRWWHDCVADRLASLPRVEGAPDAGPAAIWEYGGPAGVDRTGDRDGRAVLESDDARAGSVRRGIEEATRDPEERRAARAAFAALYARGSATSVELVEAASHLETDDEAVDAGFEHGAADDSVVVDHPSEYETAAEWAERLTEIFEVLPDVDRRLQAEGSGEAVWSYASFDPEGAT